MLENHDINPMELVLDALSISSQVCTKQSLMDKLDEYSSSIDVGYRPKGEPMNMYYKWFFSEDNPGWKTIGDYGKAEPNKYTGY